MASETWQARVSRLSNGRLGMVDTPDRGRCLLTLDAFKCGDRVHDEAVIHAGTQRGTALARASKIPMRGLLRNDVAALDFLASLVESLAMSASSGCDIACVDAERPTNPLPSTDLPLGFGVLHELMAFDAEETPRNPMIRKMHKRWREDLSARVSVRDVEKAWSHLTPNWRQLNSATMHGMWVEDGEGKTRVALYTKYCCGLWLLVSLAEHSCDPNFLCVCDGDGNSSLVALRDVEPGEHITTSYLNLVELAEPGEERRKNLSDKWQFMCACSRCTAESMPDCQTCDQKNVVEKTTAGSLETCIGFLFSQKDAKFLDDASARARFGANLQSLAELQGGGEVLRAPVACLRALILGEDSEVSIESEAESGCPLLVEAVRLFELVHGAGSEPFHFAKALRDTPLLCLQNVVQDAYRVLVEDGRSTVLWQDLGASDEPDRDAAVLCRRLLEDVEVPKGVGLADNFRARTVLRKLWAQAHSARSWELCLSDSGVSYAHVACPHQQ